MAPQVHTTHAAHARHPTANAPNEDLTPRAHTAHASHPTDDTVCNVMPYGGFHKEYYRTC